MEDSKLYSTQDIEKVKEKIEHYRETLTSLKMGTSLEDYLFMKKEFDGLKTQIAHLEGLTETLDDRQNSQIKSYEEQIKLLSTQIELLNQTIEEMNQEILIVLKKLLTMEVNEAPAPTTTPSIESHSPLIANAAQRQPTITMAQNQSAITSKQPSYRLLQNLAGKATNKQFDLNHTIQSSGTEHQKSIPEERHFNQHYFQSVNTHPSQGLYRNTNTESTFHFKNATDAKQIPVSIYDPTTINSSIIGETKPEIISEPTAMETPEVANNFGGLEASQEEILDTPNAINEGPVSLDVSQTGNESIVLDSPEAVNKEPGVLNSSETVNKDTVVLDSSKTANIETGVLDSSEAVNKDTVVLDSSEAVNKDTVVLDSSEAVNKEPVVFDSSEAVNKVPVVFDSSEAVNKVPVVFDSSEAVNKDTVVLVSSETMNEPAILTTSEALNEQNSTNMSPTLKSDESEAISEETIETYINTQDVNKQPEQEEKTMDEEHKKEKGSLFSNFFRKWT
ncbi:hypothetical protein [Lysinibacillus pakistanensis]|uniref:Uncharacterized protein n=1 Tax=Lysinibacillus pakistanensis TaxID=759811 RepID=A0AAX3WU84_9BACI|nr:hypothetical protein [Lysinibacillus pakistanensis]MDM5230753.1 hypothetical protein [Lysinibacillus pakistanensis]WHY46324.1 hypothetical protein QNH22_24300 [Lysinibacillus pakistanensis]WHY51336.1 hypothetical protein QNH24_24260 [Lysinibacillus pakistanensis]